MAKPSDLLFFENLATLLSICYKGRLGDKKTFSSSLTILLDFITLNPSNLNQKVIQSDVPNMMLSDEDPNKAIS